MIASILYYIAYVLSQTDSTYSSKENKASISTLVTLCSKMAAYLDVRRVALIPPACILAINTGRHFHCLTIIFIPTGQLGYVN